MLFSVLLGVPAGKNGISETSTKPPAHPASRGDGCVNHTWLTGVGVLLGMRRCNCRVVRPGEGNRQKALSQC